MYEYCLVAQVELVSRVKRQRRTATRSSLDDQLSYHYKNFVILDGDFRKDERVQPAHVALRPALLAVNRQIHVEAIPLLYTQPVHVADTTVLYDFFTGIGPANRRLLRQIHLYHRAQNRSTARHLMPNSLTAAALNVSTCA